MFATTATCIFFWLGIICSVVAILVGIADHMVAQNLNVTIMMAFLSLVCVVCFVVLQSVHDHEMLTMNKIANRYCIVDQKARSGFYDPEVGKIICQHEHSWPTIKKD